MRAHEPPLVDRDWWAAHTLVASFGVLVAAMLVVVPGWSAPLHAWVTLAAFVNGVLSCHAAARAFNAGRRREWRAAMLGLTLAAGLAAASAGLLGLGRWVDHAGRDELPLDPPGARP